MINQIVENDNNKIQNLKHQNVKNDKEDNILINDNIKYNDDDKGDLNNIQNDNIYKINNNTNETNNNIPRDNTFFNNSNNNNNASENLTNADNSILKYHNDLFKCNSNDSISEDELDLSYIHNSNKIYQNKTLKEITKNDTKIKNKKLSKLSKLKYFINDNSSYSHLNIPRKNPSNNSISNINKYKYHNPNIIRNKFTTTNFLKPSMIFTGYQISGYKKYQVTVTLKTVNFTKGSSNVTSPHMTGFLSINGLTNNHPEISTFFDAYAVTDSKFGFLSSTWDHLNSLTSTDENDLEHWYNFPAFKQFKQFNNLIDDYLNERFIFMRWKEKFLIDDPSLDTIEGASYDGYYYIVHDQFTGNIQGFYYHKDAEKFQQLELMPYGKHPGNNSFELV